MQIAFLGFGLIGGSIARAVRANPETKDWTMAAWSPSGEGPRKAAADLVIDVAGAKAEAILRDADLIVLAGPATSCLPLIDRLAGKWRTMIRPDAIVTDVASTKKVIVERADAAGLWFVGGHPMAGREDVGYEASDADLFVDRPWVVVPGALAGESDIERVTELAVACRANVVRMDAAVHDRAVAAISHLPLDRVRRARRGRRHQARRRQVARGGTRRVAGRRRSGRRRLARHVPPRPRRPGDGRRDRRDECRPNWGPGCATFAACSTPGRPSSTGPTAPTRRARRLDWPRPRRSSKKSTK